MSTRRGGGEAGDDGAGHHPAPVPRGPSELSLSRAIEVLSEGEIELRGRLPWSSNATFLVTVRGNGATAMAIYKPGKGERPLWDFPRGLWKREIAAYELSELFGWGIVPPTVARDDGPLGPGSLQYCIDALFEEHYFTLLESPAHHAALRRIAVFDLVANNADRKAGHCLVDGNGKIWAIDNGLCFHAEPKLRTVIWDFAGERVDAQLLDSLRPLAGGEVPAGLAGWLGDDEVAALVARARRVRARGKYPEPTSEFRYPWPLI